MAIRIGIRGGGDLASGIAIRLHRAGWQVFITETPQPMVVRRTVAFAEAVFCEEVGIEGVIGRKIYHPSDIEKVCWGDFIPVFVDPCFECRKILSPQVVVDARMLKQPSELGCKIAPLVIGLGPGFLVGRDCHAVVETNRGPFLGRVYWQGGAEPDTGVPGNVKGYGSERVLRSPKSGVFQANAKIGDIIEEGEVIGVVDGMEIYAPFRGLLRGLLCSGLSITEGAKIGDIDPRLDNRLCTLVSDKSLAIAGGVLEAILSYFPLRQYLYA